MGIFLKNNIKYLNKYLTKGFLEIKNIYVSDDEAVVITKLIKENFDDLYHRNYHNTFNELKQVVDSETYEKILNLYLNLSF